MGLTAGTPVAVTTHEDDTCAWEMARRCTSPALGGQVLGYCGYVERSSGPFRRREVPGGTITVILSFGDPIELVEMGNSTQRPGRFSSFVAGIHEGHAVTEHGGRQGGVQIDLTPLGAYRLLGLPMAELANRVVGTDELGIAGLVEVNERMCELSTWADRFDLLDATLARWAAEGPEPDRGVAWAWRQLKRSHGAVAVRDLVDEIGWSRRHFGSRFRSQVGLAPKPTGRVLRFRHAVDLLLADDRRTFTDVATAAGYADHSHLTREFRTLAGCPPSELVANQLPDEGGVAA